MRKLLFIAAFFLIVTPAKANDIYLGQNAIGGATGADCADALPYTFFNSSSNWGSGGNKIGPGTTVHICGTITAPAGANSFLTFRGSGNNGNPITLLFENGAVLTANYWSGAAIDINGQSFVTVDGGANGIIRATANGTSLANQQDNGLCVQQKSGDATNITVQNLTCANLYIDNSTSDGGGEDTYGMDIWNTTNLTIQNNTIHDMKWGIRQSYQVGHTYSNLTVANNTIYNIDHGWFVTDSSSSGSAVMTNFQIHGNKIHDFANWDNSNDNNHHDGLHVNTNSSSSQFSDFQIYGNHIYGSPGSFGNAAFFSFPASAASVTGVFIFNNLFENDSPNMCWANGFVAFAGVGASTVVNNTMVSLHTSCAGVSAHEYGYIFEDGSTNARFENNIVINTPGNAVQAGPNAGTVLAFDYNDYYQSSSWTDQTKNYSSLSAWQGASNNPVFDLHSNTANPSLDASFNPTASSTAIATGVNLTSLCSSAPQLCMDMKGTPRSSSGAWYMGAVQFGTSASGPQPPTALTASVN
jgi:hypothetical protein